MVKRNLIPTLEHELLLDFPLENNPLVARFNKTDFCITFKNASRLWMGSLEYPERAEGPNVDFIWVDEARLVRDFETAWLVIQRRLRGSKPGMQIGAWVTTTPPSPGPFEAPTPLYKFFEHPKHKSPDAKVYRWSIFDNPHLPKWYLEEMKRSHTGALGERFLYGLFTELGAGSYPFNSKTHVLRDIDKNMIKDVVYGVDFGWTNPSCVVVIGFDGDRRAYILDEYYKPQIRNEDLIIIIRELQQEWGEGPLYCDRSEPRTIDELSRERLDARADKSKRDDGIREMGGRFEVAGDERPRIYVSSRCVNWISEVQVYNPEKKEFDHAMDATRYALMGAKGQRGEIKVSFFKPYG